MAWTTPGTAVAGEVLTAAFWNEQVRDNALAIRQAQINVKSTIVTASSTYSIAAGSSADITGLSVSITPSSSTSKVLLLVHVAGAETSTVGSFGFRLLRGATELALGDAAGSAIRLSGRGRTDSDTSSELVTFAFLDSPATTSATTYKITLIGIGSAGSATYVINRPTNNTTSAPYSRETSGITAIEVPV
jgi:hypothetical protein